LKPLVLKYLSKPWVVSLFLFLLLFKLLPQPEFKYKLTLISQDEIIPHGGIITYADIDNNDSSERFVSIENSWGKSGFLMHNSNGELIDQWNTSFTPINKQGKLFFEDINNDSIAEVIQFTRHLDSIFMNISIINNELNKPTLSIFVDTIGNFNPDTNYAESSEFSVTGVAMNKTVNTSKVFFSIATGFSGYPRNVYSWDTETGKLHKSSHLGNRTGLVHLMDLDKDDNLEILLSSHSSSNDKWFNSNYYQRTDESSWIMVLNHDLKFKFPPKEINSEFSAINQDTIMIKKERFIITAAFIRKEDDGQSKLYKISQNGSFVDSISLKAKNGLILPNPNSDKIILHSSSDDLLESYDYNLNLIDQIRIPKNSYSYALDLDADKLNEWLCFDYNIGQVHVYENNFKKAADLVIPELKGNRHKGIGIKFDKGDPSIWLQINDREFKIKYELNPAYFLSWLLFPFTYVILLIITTIIIRVQQLKEKRIREIDQELSKLQVRVIKNQIDPHFVFNAMNTIAEMKINDKMEVDQFICDFSDLMRKTITGSDKILHPLKQEVAYVENYVRLQSVSHGWPIVFSYSIKPEYLYDFLVPKHLIYTYVENAIKHGFYSIEEKGLINVSVYTESENEKVILEIENNGDSSNRMSIGADSRSTGNGLKIMDDMFALIKEQYQMVIETETKILKKKNQDWYTVKISIEDNKISQ